MGSKLWRFAGLAASAGLASGLITLVSTDDAHTIGEALFAAGLAVVALAKAKRWITDTTYERERLRHAIANADDAALQANVGRAILLSERERDRRLLEEGRQEADRRVQQAETELEQAEINLGMRAHTFEEGCEQRYAHKLAEGIAAAERRADITIAAHVLDAANKRTQLMISQFIGGVLAERNGDVDDMLAALEDPNVIHLHERRPQALQGKTAEGRN